MQQPSDTLISIIVPMYNEQENLGRFYDALCAGVASLTCKLEFIFVDDGSRDGSFHTVQQLSRRDSRVNCVRFSRNFGSIAAYTAGLQFARGNAAVVIASDLQDPPSLIPELVAKWRQGSYVVWAVREARDDPFFKKFFARMWVYMLRGIGFKDYPLNGIDFGLFDRKVIDAYLKMPETSRIFSGMIMWLGFPADYVPYRRVARNAGQSKWSFGRRLRTAIDSVVSFSQLPIWSISYLGFAISLFSLLYAIFLVLGRLFFGIGDVGWASLMIAILLIGGVQMIMLGIIGEYVWRAADQARQRPHFVVLDTLGLEPASQDRTEPPA